MKINNKGYAITIIVFGILIVFIVVLSSLLITMNNSVKLNKTVKEEVIENIQLSSDATGLTITERISKLESEMSGMLDKIYPVGSIYISTDDDTEEKVEARFGGKWQAYSEGRTLVGVSSSEKVNTTGGSYSQTLKVANLPSHTHNITYSKVNSTTENTTLTQKHFPIRTAFELTNNTTSSFTVSGVRVYSIELPVDGWAVISNYDAYRAGLYSSPGGEGHNHVIKTTDTKVTSEGTGEGNKFSVRDPYITVYMYKRIS